MRGVLRICDARNHFHRQCRGRFLLLALVGGVLFAAALGLWAYYGTAVFFEMVRTGWISCF